MNLTYGIHPSRPLVELFKIKPYQGANPETARIIILGNDANYSPEISDHRFFKVVLDYHGDGVAFWRRHSAHHPFVHRDYPLAKNRGGVTYHRNFSKLGFDSTFAHVFSFVELLDVPTMGNTGSNRKLFFDLMNRNHLAWLEDIILGGQEKFVLLNRTLINNIAFIKKRFGALSRLDQRINEPIVRGSELRRIYRGYSFSHAVTNSYLNTLSKEMREFISDSKR